MSISEAIEDIQQKTKRRTGKQIEKRSDTCARQFAKALMDSYPDLMFWQNTPPDPEDLTNEKADLVPEVVRQIWPCPVKISGRTIGSWLLDVYPGSRKAVQFGNKLNEPYQFNYEDAFTNDRAHPEVADLPQPLMKHFRADLIVMKSICSAERHTAPAPSPDNAQMLGEGDVLFA